MEPVTPKHPRLRLLYSLNKRKLDDRDSVTSKEGDNATMEKAKRAKNDKKAAVASPSVVKMTAILQQLFGEEHPKPQISQLPQGQMSYASDESDYYKPQNLSKPRFIASLRVWLNEVEQTGFTGAYYDTKARALEALAELVIPSLEAYEQGLKSPPHKSLQSLELYPPLGYLRPDLDPAILEQCRNAVAPLLRLPFKTIRSGKAIGAAIGTQLALKYRDFPLRYSKALHREIIIAAINYIADHPIANDTSDMPKGTKYTLKQSETAIAIQLVTKLSAVFDLTFKLDVSTQCATAQEIGKILANELLFMYADFNLARRFIDWLHWKPFIYLQGRTLWKQKEAGILDLCVEGDRPLSLVQEHLEAYDTEYDSEFEKEFENGRMNAAAFARDLDFGEPAVSVSSNVDMAEESEDYMDGERYKSIVRRLFTTEIRAKADTEVSRTMKESSPLRTLTRTLSQTPRRSIGVMTPSNSRIRRWIEQNEGDADFSSLQQ